MSRENRRISFYFLKVMDTIDYEALDPGIRKLVRILRWYGFNTTDSGDGVTKFKGQEAPKDALPFPHVAMTVEPEQLVRTAKWLVVLFKALGVSIGQMTMDEASPSIEASYDPVTDVAVIMIAGIDDSMLGPFSFD